MEPRYNSDVPDCQVSIVVVNWNTEYLLRGCLASIQRETRAAHEIIVIDNASSDGSAGMVTREFPDAHLIANTSNRGFAAANNQGLRIARGRRVLLLNPDTVILNGAIDTMLEWMDAHPDVGCAGCQVWEDEQTIQKTCFADPGPWSLFLTAFALQRLAPAIPVFGHPEYRGWDRRSERDVDVVSGMFMLVPRDVVERTGPLDEAFFIYSEEADWCRRIRNAGYRCVFTPAARILHLDGGSKSTSQIRSAMYVQLQKSEMIYLRKHHGWPGGAVGKIIFLASGLLRFALAVLQQGTEGQARRRLASVSLNYHLTGREPAA